MLRKLFETESKPVFSRLVESGDSMKRRKELAIKNAQAAEAQSNKPKINEYSRKLKRQGNIADALIASQQKTKEKLEMLRRQKEEKEV